MSQGEVKQQVRQFYDQVGWQKVAGDQYQNARYEDLRPVSADYIQRTRNSSHAIRDHERVLRRPRPECKRGRLPDEPVKRMVP